VTQLRRYRDWMVASALAVGLMSANAACADLECSAQVTSRAVPRGGEVVLKVTAAGDIGWSVDFALPAITGVKAYSGGTSQNMTMTNGATRTTVTRSWYLRVETAEDFTIGAIAVTARGESCRTAPIVVKVLPAAATAPDNSGNRQPAAGRAPVRTTGGHAADDIFVTLDADKEVAWVGEQIVLSFRYWRRVQPWNNPAYEAPRTEGFWREELGPERTYRQVLDGRTYNVTHIRYALFPTRAGELVIEPASLSFPEDVFDRFFNSRRRSRGPRTLRTDPVTIRVRTLPTPVPADYTGLVANAFSLTAQVDRDTVPAGEPVELKIDLHTDGFLKGFAGITVREPDGARLHDSSETFNSGLKDDRLRGSLAVEKVVVPEVPGDLVITPVQVVWFDAGAGRYRTAEAAPRTVHVTAGDRDYNGEPGHSGFLRSEISRLGEDLAFIHPAPRNLGRDKSPFTGSPAWWSLLLAPMVLLGIWRVLLVRLSAERRQPHLRRRRRALATAQAVLRNAERVDSDGPGQIVRAICGFVADSEDRPLAAVGLAEVSGFCDRVDRHALGESLVALLERCESARYGGGVDAATLDAEITRVGKQLAELAQSKRRVGTVRAKPAVILLAAMALGASAPHAQTGATAEQLLAEGNQSYTEGNLDVALDRYMAAVVAGANDPVLHYNLGNVHARRGELGRALASYERARRLAPRNQDILSNMAWVRRQLRDLELAGGELPLFIRQFVGLARSLTLDQCGTLTLVIAWCLASVVALAWGRDRFGDVLRRLSLGLGACLLFSLAVTGWRWYGERVVDTAMVRISEATVRSGPAERFPALFQVHDGLPVTLHGAADGWVRISLGGDWQGWLPVAAVEKVRSGD